MSPSQQPVPPTRTIEVLTGDLLAMEVAELLRTVALGAYPRYQRLLGALAAYCECRNLETEKPPTADPQRCTVANWEHSPETQRSSGTMPTSGESAPDSEVTHA